MSEFADTSVVGNARYYGFIKDLLDEIGERLNFRYQLRPSIDGRYGTKSARGDTWNGLVGMVLNKVMDRLSYEQKMCLQWDSDP